MRTRDEYVPECGDQEQRRLRQVEAEADTWKIEAELLIQALQEAKDGDWEMADELLEEWEAYEGNVAG